MWKLEHRVYQKKVGSSPWVARYWGKCHGLPFLGGDVTVSNGLLVNRWWRCLHHSYLSSKWMLHIVILRLHHSACDGRFARTKVSLMSLLAFQSRGISSYLSSYVTVILLCSTSLYGSRGGVRAADAASVEEEPSEQDCETVPGSFRSDGLEYFGSPVSRKSIRTARVHSRHTYGTFLPHVATFQVQSMHLYRSICLNQNISH